MKGLTDVFVRRPVLAIVVNLLILVAGVQAIRSLSVRQYPRLELATVTISTVYVGASADLVRGFITTPIERAISAADGIEYIESESTQGISTIRARLRLNFPASDALADISARVNQVRNELPPEAELPTILIEPSDAQIAAMYLSFRSPILEPNQVTDYLVREVQPRLSAIDGVQRADLLGGRAFALRAWLDPQRMASLGVSPSDVSRALADENYLAAVGNTDGALVRVDLTATTDLQSVDQFRRLVVRRDGDTLIRLADVADVQLGSESYDQDVRFAGERAVFMGVWVRPNANALEVIERVRAELALLQADLPVGMEATVAYDSTEYIEDAIREVTRTLLETVLIVVLVITAFLGSLRGSIVPVVAIPLSLIGAVFLMQVLGFTLNLLTLLAIVLSVGLVVDDAIVVVENVERHIREGQTRVQAALLGARELVGPIIAMTITLLAVYVPVGFQGGMTGELFREFAFTLAGAVLISGIVALTLSPVMSSRLVPEKQGRIARAVARAFSAVQRGYGHALDTTLAMRPVVYVVWILIALATIPMFMLSSSELAPEEDQGVVFSSLEVPANASLEQVSAYAGELQHVFEQDPDYHQSFQLTTPGTAFGGMIAAPWQERERDIFAIQGALTPRVSAIAGVRAPLFLPAALPSPGTLPIEFVVSASADHEEIVRYTERLTEIAAQSGEFAFPPISDVRFDEARADIVLDRDQIAAMGVNMGQIGSDLSWMLSGNYVNRFNMAGRSYRVIPQIVRTSRLVPRQLQDIHVTGPNGTLIPLGAIATLQETVEPRTLNRFQQLNSVKLSGVPARSVDAALRVLEEAAAETLPPGYRVDYTGESRQLRQEAGKFLPVLGLALLVIFLVLAAQFDSFRDPFVILAGSVPLALFGALVFTFLHFEGPPGVEFGLTSGWTTTLNIYSQVGLVTLVGLIAKHGILIVEFANDAQREGLSKIEAVKHAAATRLRPILMTTAATIAGHFPLTLVTGPGAEARNSIGLVLVGGMAIGTIFTLFVVPAVYVLIAREHRVRVEEKRREEEPEMGGALLPSPAE
ncbi:efflux RND transporter permease subunit [Sandaracinus amylolyticus]|uniref:RND multidrug efflux transporter n=1 Tax=Sandaracinus amylolyticus TaxID=927083 RepID=A0A0F6SI80_9BACT|nr:efflux RND transporter permease subunit [Sandaracinus amylolyticus]AKF11729.1 RND multidrug efflux transporter [Sandaracinus amylolyticus]